MEKEGVLYTSLPNGRAICNLCYRRCNIPENGIGFCGVRENIKGKIYSTIYGKIIALNIDPIDVAKLARKHKLFNTFVTNGYMTPEAAELASKYIDAMTVDFKGNASEAFARKYISIVSESGIFDTLKVLKEKKVFIEITDLVVPKIGDSLEDAEKLVKWVYNNLGPETPIHFLRFHPDFKMTNIEETPIETLEANII